MTSPIETSRTRAPRRRGGDRGVVLVEMAFILPILLMLVFGMVTFGIALSQGNAIENAAREASRYGSTRPVPGTSIKTWLDEVTDVAIAASTGDLGASAPDRFLCVALVGSGEVNGRRETIGTAVHYSGSGNCPDATCPNSDPCVQVVLERSATLEAVAFERSITIGGTSVSAFEREP